jgi:very-short-patch-repair endonuclease
MLGRCEELARKQFGVLHRRQALASGLSRHSIDRLVASRRWTGLFPCVYRIIGATESWQQLIFAAHLWAGADAVASHRAAAALWELDGCHPGVIELTSPRYLRRPPTLVVHRSSVASFDCTWRHGIPLTTPARTLLDLGAVVDRSVVEMAVEDALRRGLVSLPRLRWTLDRLGRRGRPGTSPLREVLENRGKRAVTTDSALEVKLLRVLRSAGLPEPVAQFHVRDRGRVIARVDFAYPEYKLAIEVDGYEFHSRKADWQRDRTVQNALTLRGWRVLRVTNEDVDRHPNDVIDQVRAARRFIAGGM